ncbi:Dihydrofolate reductase [Natronorubrum sediminis]|uniref:Dihydrofolate reductase n=1 Tax=Natronorubrum sediminis TaxID=640943 RepID=A0A1H6FZV5_9EURY|nr:dihydrofolate reductase family protein [Natronorubrum sediminis]SEH16346.1 Dihydrofolate reductase [Natronorubrum sediminis]
MGESRPDEPTGTIVVATFLTLDGVMQAPGGPEEDREGGFEYGGWSVTYWDESMGERMDRQFAEADALLLGRKTYELFASHWPTVDPEDDPTANRLNTMPKYVASRTLEEVTWTNSTRLSGDVADAVSDLGLAPDDVLMVQGSHDMIQSLLAADLVDEFWLWIFPLVLGEGKQLFDDGTIPAALELQNVETSSTGVQMLRYERAGDLEYGSFAVDGEEDESASSE